MGYTPPRTGHSQGTPHRSDPFFDAPSTPPDSDERLAILMHGLPVDNREALATVTRVVSNRLLDRRTVTTICRWMMNH